MNNAVEHATAPDPIDAAEIAILRRDYGAALVMFTMSAFRGTVPGWHKAFTNEELADMGARILATKPRREVFALLAKHVSRDWRDYIAKPLRARAPESPDELEERREAMLYAASDGAWPLP